MLTLKLVKEHSTEHENFFDPRTQNKTKHVTNFDPRTQKRPTKRKILELEQKKKTKLLLFFHPCQG